MCLPFEVLTYPPFLASPRRRHKLLRNTCIGFDGSSALVTGLCHIDITPHPSCFCAKARTSVFLSGGLCINTHPQFQFSLTGEENLCTPQAALEHLNFVLSPLGKTATFRSSCQRPSWAADRVPAPYHVGGIKCPYWLFFLIGPTWHRISFKTGTSCGLKYKVCFKKPLLNHHFSCGTQDIYNCVPSFFLTIPPTTLLIPPGAPFPSYTFSHCLQTKNPQTILTKLSNPSLGPCIRQNWVILAADWVEDVGGGLGGECHCVS